MNVWPQDSVYVDMHYVMLLVCAFIAGCSFSFRRLTAALLQAKQKTISCWSRLVASYMSAKAAHHDHTMLAERSADNL